MQCNIDTNGRRIRRTIGLACLVVAAILFGAAVVWQPLTLGIVGATFAVAGAFCVWEAKAGYCVVRGMGLKTPF